MQIPHFLVRHALCHVHLREIPQALALYDEAIALATGSDRRNFEFHARLLRAHRAARRTATRTARSPACATSLAECRESGYFGFLRLPADVLSPVLALALAHGVETDYVRTLIRKRKLPPPGPDVAGLAVAGRAAHVRRILDRARRRAAGVEGQGAEEAARAPEGARRARRPRRGRDDADGLVWPDAEGDDAKTSFDSNLYRLRKLLDIDGVLQLADGKLSLNPELVWLDVWAFEAALDAGDVDAALALYRGHFLALDAPLPWTLPARDRLQSEARARRARGGRRARARARNGRARGRCTSARSRSTTSPRPSTAASWCACARKATRPAR